MKDGAWRSRPLRETGGGKHCLKHRTARASLARIIKGHRPMVMAPSRNPSIARPSQVVALCVGVGPVFHDFWRGLPSANREGELPHASATTSTIQGWPRLRSAGSSIGAANRTLRLVDDQGLTAR